MRSIVDWIGSGGEQQCFQTTGTREIPSWQDETYAELMGQEMKGR